MSTVSDEQLVAAIMSSGTLHAAAEACGVSERTLYSRMKDFKFQTIYKSARSDVLRIAVARMSDHLEGAVATIAEIMNDKEANPATRLQAAQTVISYCGKFVERLLASDALVQNASQFARF